MSPVNVVCCTWNARGATPEPELLRTWLCRSECPPDILAVTVQEMMDLKPVEIALAKLKSQKAQKWLNATLEAVNGHEAYKGVRYDTVETTSLLGLFIIVLAKVSITHGISNARTGYSYANTALGNKGGVGVRFDYVTLDPEDKSKTVTRSYCFVGVHLTAHAGTDSQKNKDLEVITKRMVWSDSDTTKSITSRPSSHRAPISLSSSINGSKSSRTSAPAAMGTNLLRRKKFSPKKKKPTKVTRANRRTNLKPKDSPIQTTTKSKRPNSKSVYSTHADVSEAEDTEEITLLQHDVVFVFGDLNYRLENVTHEEVVSNVRDNKLKELQVNYDHLKKNMRKDYILVGFTESPIKFPPTYKFEVGSDNYIHKRVPAWTDRVLYKTSDKINSVEQVMYDWVPEIRCSDHKPVIAEYILL